MTRAIAYVDGFNLYFGLKSKGWKQYYWLDLGALVQRFLKPDQRLDAVHYFTTRIRDNGRNAADRQRQNVYIDAVRARGVRVQEGHYLEKDRQCRKCGNVWRDYEEKMTDVNIATQLLADAFEDAFDVAFVLSGDSDLTTPLTTVKARFPAKRIVVLLPPDRHSKQLKQVAHGYLSIGEDKLRQSQLPDEVVSASGFVLKRPGHWK